MARHTQESCQIRFGEAMARLARELDQIDQDTPATPETEPEWWVRMMDQHPQNALISQGAGGLMLLVGQT